MNFCNAQTGSGYCNSPTHAHAGGRSEPGIEFFDRTLTLPEIYARRIPASLVALSACETGTGEYAEGEGVLSLARAFAYAGAESLMASHWSVNERATAELFAGFYAQIEQGVSRAEALRQAKLAWLDKSQPDARKAPWYWAAITLSGADGAVDLHENTDWWWYAGGGIFALLAGGWFLLAARMMKRLIGLMRFIGLIINCLSALGRPLHNWVVGCLPSVDMPLSCRPKGDI